MHTHTPKPGIYGRLGGRAARVPVVVNTVHGLYATAEDSWARRAAVYGVERLAATCSDAELVQNEEDLSTLASLRVPADRLHLLGNGIDLERFVPGPKAQAARARIRAELGVDDATVVVGAVGRLVWEKGYGELFAAAGQLRRRCPEVTVVVAGPSEPEKADGIGPAALAAAESSGVRFLGHRSDVEDLYAAFDVYVLASYREGFPRSAMEAAAMGLPVVATDIRGCRQVVEHGVDRPAGAPARCGGPHRRRGPVGRRPRSPHHHGERGRRQGEAGVRPAPGHCDDARRVRGIARAQRCAEAGRSGRGRAKGLTAARRPPLYPFCPLNSGMVACPPWEIPRPRRTTSGVCSRMRDVEGPACDVRRTRRRVRISRPR